MYNGPAYRLPDGRMLFAAYLPEKQNWGIVWQEDDNMVIFDKIPCGNKLVVFQTLHRYAREHDLAKVT